MKRRLERGTVRTDGDHQSLRRRLLGGNDLLQPGLCEGLLVSLSGTASQCRVRCSAQQGNGAADRPQIPWSNPRLAVSRHRSRLCAYFAVTVRLCAIIWNITAGCLTNTKQSIASIVSGDYLPGDGGGLSRSNHQARNWRSLRLAAFGALVWDCAPLFRKSEENLKGAFKLVIPSAAIPWVGNDNPTGHDRATYLGQGEAASNASGIGINYIRNWPVGRVPARIWRSRIHFLSTAPSKATTILFPINTTGFNLGERRSSRVSAATQKGEGLVPNPSAIRSLG